jgi:hypothetical protein
VVSKFISIPNHQTCVVLVLPGNPKLTNSNPTRDQELRFIVHDSPDYYTLKISIFDEGKRTELIGEAWLDLQNVIVPGGGELNLWQDLKCKGKYAGDVRFELTYYDSRPKAEKLVSSKKTPSRVAEDSQGSIGSSGVRRRPLPTNPSSSTSTESPRLHASGPRQLGAPPPQPRPTEPPAASSSSISVTRKSLHNNNNNIPQPVDHQDHQDPFVQNHQPTDFHNDYNNPQPHTHTTPEANPDPYQHNGQYAQDHNQLPSSNNNQSLLYREPADFLPELPPINRNRESALERRSRLSIHNDYDQPAASYQNAPPAVHALQPAPYQNAPDVQALQPRRSHQVLASPQQANQFAQGSDHGWEGHHSQTSQQPPHDQYAQQDSQFGYDQYRDYHQNLQESPSSQYPQQEDPYSLNREPFELPPPPPAHRDTPPAADPARNYQSSPAYAYDDQSPQSRERPRGGGGSYSNSPLDPSRRLRGHLTSKSEVSLVMHSDSEDRLSSFDDHYRRNRRSSFEPAPPDDFALQRHRGYGDASAISYDQPLYEQNMNVSPTRKEVPRTPVSSGQPGYDATAHYENHAAERRDSYHSISSHGSGSLSRLARQHHPQHSQTYPPVQQSPYGSSPHFPSPQSMNASSSHLPSPSPTRPHPLSQEHTIPSSSPTHYPQEGGEAMLSSAYGPIPIIKPLAISARKSIQSIQTTPASADRLVRPAGRSPTARKSISPRPSFSAFSPDSYNTLNPSGHSSPGSALNPESAGPIVDFHGNVIDPMDRLPEVSWAPEPSAKTPAKDPSDVIPASSWAPEPEGSRRQSEPRKVTVRTRDKVLGARASPNSSFNVSMTCNAQRHGAFGSPSSGAHSGGVSPVSTGSPAGRNRLRKLNRPQSIATTAPSWSAAGHDNHQGSSPGGYVHTHHPGSIGAGPPIPDKIPLEKGHGDQGMVPYTGVGRHSIGGDVDRLSMEIRSIDIGGVGESGPRRIGGRRLLGYQQG